MRLLFYILFFGLTAWLWYFLQQNPGTVSIAYGDWVVDMDLWVPVIGGILIIFVFSIIFSIFASVVKSYRRFREWLTGSTLTAVARNANHGWVAFAEGDWSRAESYMLKAAKHSEYPLNYYLTAAKAAQELAAIERRDNYLHLAAKVDPETRLAVGLTQAELQLQQGQYEYSLVTLQDLQKLAPNNSKVLQLLARVFTFKAEWSEIIKLLPQLKKHAALHAVEFTTLEVQAYSHILDLEAAKAGKDGLIVLWDSLPKNARQETAIIQCYAQLLLANGAYDEAEQLIRNTLKKQWDINLVKLYGLALSSDLSKQIANAETWLRTHKSEPALLLSLARLCLAHKLWGKARSYLDASLFLEANADAYAELGRLLGFLGEQQKAMECYKKGLLEFAAVLPIENAQK